MVRRAAGLLVVLLALSACNLRHGSIENGRYAAPGRLFEVRVPPLGPGGHVDDFFAAEGFMVAFNDDGGQLYRIDGAPAASAGFGPGVDRRRALEAAFARLSFRAIQSASRSAIYSRQEWDADLHGGSVLYKVILPGNSAARGDKAMRAVVVYVAGDRFVQVSAQRNLPSGAQSPGEWDELRRSVRDFAASIDFEPR